MNEIIASELNNIKVQHNVKIVYAVEAGSRVWGYHSNQSDYDVRFIFIRDVKNYLSIRSSPDVIQSQKPQIEFHGWDLFKTLNLFMKSNPSLYEWLYSPIVYYEKNEFVDALRNLSRLSFSLKRMGYHYTNLARGNLKKDNKTIKMYLHIIRSLLCVRWIEVNNSLPPLPLNELVNSLKLPISVEQEIHTLVKGKQKNQKVEVSSSLLELLIDELNRIETIIPLFPDQKVDPSMLDEVIWRELGL